MKRQTLYCCTLLASLLSLQAEEQVRSTQEELRRRNIYFGDIDGKRSDEFQEALKRYQKRKGIESTGKEDPDTLRSLGLLARGENEPAPKELSWPEEPVLKSDARIQPEEKATATLAVAENPPPVTNAEPALFVWPTPVASGPEEAAPAGTAGTRRSRNAGVINVSAPAPAARGGRSMASLPQKAQQQNGSAVQTFVKGYLKAMGRRSLRDELPFYADRVDYFGNGSVDRRSIEKALRKYYAQWPSRKYTVANDVRYTLVPSRSEVIVTYRVGFSLKNQGRKVTGQTENRLVINAATADPRIVSIQERRIRG